MRTEIVRKTTKAGKTRYYRYSRYSRSQMRLFPMAKYEAERSLMNGTGILAHWQSHREMAEQAGSSR